MTLNNRTPRSDLVIRIPGSKSITHRAVIAAGLATGVSMLTDFLECEDTLYTLRGLRQVGIPTHKEGNRLIVEGLGRRPSAGPDRKEIFLGNSGTSLRLLLSVMALGRGEFLLTGTERMQQRPIGPLVSALNQLGLEAACVNSNGCPPVAIRASGIPGGQASISGDQSSQFISSILLAAPYARRDVEIALTGRLISGPYVHMTLHVMDQFGVRVNQDHEGRFTVRAGQEYMPRDLTVPGDASSASYFWAAAAVTGGAVTTTNIRPWEAWQGDIRFLEILEAMGCIIDRGPDQVTVRGRGLKGMEVDMGDLPDMVPTLAAVALFAEGRTVIRNVAHLRHKESDRLQATATEWQRMGGRVQELPDGLIIEGGAPLRGAIVDPHDDHRLAMSLAVVGLRVPALLIRNKACVGKSFPEFWNLWEDIRRALGFQPCASSRKTASAFGSSCVTGD